MKKGIQNYFILSLLLVSQTVQSQWYQVSASLFDICNAGGSTYYVAGGGGTIRKSVDSGISWELLNTKVTGDFNSIVFVNSSTGFACGENGLLKTSDAGANWTIVFSSGQRMTSVYFITEAIGYALDAVGDAYKTNNGGNTWDALAFKESISFSSADDYFNQIYFLNELTGYICRTSLTSEGGAVYVTKDGGANWNFVMKEGRYVNFIDEHTGYILKNSNTLCKTTNGGASWIELHIGVNDYLNQIRFSGTTGYAVGAAGSILKTDDGGITWVFQKSKIAEGLNSILFNSLGIVIAVGSNATLLKTENGGGNWNVLSQGPPANATGKAGCFTTPTTGYVLTSKEYLMKTLDGGVTWKRISIPTKNLLKDIFFVSENVGFIGESGGGLWKTSDAGNSWVIIPAPVDIYKIYALNENEIFVFGYGFAKTKDGGLTWTNVLNTKQWLEGTGVRTMHFLNDTLGFLLTENGLYYTGNRGDSWQKGIPSVCNICPSGVLITHFKKTLFVAGSYLYKSDDEGKSWTKLDYRKVQSSSYYSPPVDLYFTDDENAYLLLDYSDFSRSSDGGLTFNPEQFHNKGNISVRGLVFSGTHGLAFGSDGLIYRPYKMAGKYVGINEIKTNQKKRLLVYPNPATGIVNVNCQECAVGVRLDVYNAIGNIVYTSTLKEPSSETLDLSNLPKGCYSLKAGGRFFRLVLN